MRAEVSTHNFICILEEKYGDPGIFMRLVQESSAIGDYEDSVDKPGSSYLWVGKHHHLDRGQVVKLIAAMQTWLETGRLPIEV